MIPYPACPNCRGNGTHFDGCIFRDDRYEVGLILHQGWMALSQANERICLLKVERDVARNEAKLEKARADCMERQIASLRAQVAAWRKAWAAAGDLFGPLYDEAMDLFDDAEMMSRKETP